MLALKKKNVYRRVLICKYRACVGGDIEWVRPRFCRSFRIQLLTRDIDTLRGIYTYTQQRWHWMSKKSSVFRLARELHRLIKQTSLQQWRIYRQPTHHKICIGKHPICVYVSWHVKICKQESECFGENMKHDSISNFCIQQLYTLVDFYNFTWQLKFFYKFP